MHKNWLQLTFDTWALGLEASAVVGLRAMRFATGTAPHDESTRMVAEKLEAAMVLQARAMTGRVGAGTAVKHYRRKVRANRKRLSRA